MAAFPNNGVSYDSVVRRNFEAAKVRCLGKRDKSSAGRIDPRAVEICALLNSREPYFTTSSCAGRCFLYRGEGVKSTTRFTRFRVAHGLVDQPERYFDLRTLHTDPTGGSGDPIPSKTRDGEAAEEPMERGSLSSSQDDAVDNPAALNSPASSRELEHAVFPTEKSSDVIWLRFEPFILHVACRSMGSAEQLMNAARPSFKNVGVTTWNDPTATDVKSSANQQFCRYLVAIWGDEGLEMPLTTPQGVDLTDSFGRDWLAVQVNEKHERNWSKIERFVRSVREMDEIEDQENGLGTFLEGQRAISAKLPRSYDVVGDVAILHTIGTDDPEERKVIGQEMMKKNKAIKVVVLRESNLVGKERASPDLIVLAGAERRSNGAPLITTHSEYGVKAVVDLDHTFFSPRMSMERLRICQQVARGEHVLVLFAGVAMEALQVACRTEADEVVAVEQNPKAIECSRRSHRLLERNKSVKCRGASERLKIVQGDVLEVVPTLQRDFYDRVLAPRPKEGALDGDLASGGGGGREFLNVIMSVMKRCGGECHWYDFCADNEYPECARSRSFLEEICRAHDLKMQVLNVANVGSVAIRQQRVCIDFRVSPLSI